MSDSMRKLYWFRNAFGTWYATTRLPMMWDGIRIVENIEGLLHWARRFPPDENGLRVVSVHEIDLKLIEEAVRIIRQMENNKCHST